MTNMIEVILIRHGKTKGNLRRNYIGRTDEPLCRQGVDELTEKKAAASYPAADMLFVSPMKRCRQTAELLYPGLSAVVVDDLRECNFGEFENKNYQDLAGNAAYQAWLDSNGESPFPGGESREEFAARCLRGFAAAVEQALAADVMPRRVALVVHGGTIMALLAACTDLEYFQAMCSNGEGWRVRLDADIWREEGRLLDPEPLFGAE